MEKNKTKNVYPSSTNLLQPHSNVEWRHKRFSLDFSLNFAEWEQ